MTHQNPSPYIAPTRAVSPKEKLVALILAIGLGVLGFHYFYVGRTGKGILYLLTFGLFGLGPLFDALKIANGKFTDADGLPLID